MPLAPRSSARRAGLAATVRPGPSSPRVATRQSDGQRVDECLPRLFVRRVTVRFDQCGHERGATLARGPRCPGEVPPRRQPAPDRLEPFPGAGPERVMEKFMRTFLRSIVAAGAVALAASRRPISPSAQSARASRPDGGRARPRLRQRAAVVVGELGHRQGRGRHDRGRARQRRLVPGHRAQASRRHPGRAELLEQRARRSRAPPRWPRSARRSA